MRVHVENQFLFLVECAQVQSGKDWYKAFVIDFIVSGTLFHE